MQYKNDCLIISDCDTVRINEQFNEYLQHDEYYIIDVDMIANDIGNIMIGLYEKEVIYDKIGGIIDDILDELKMDLKNSIEEYIDNNLEA